MVPMASARTRRATLLRAMAVIGLAAVVRVDARGAPPSSTPQPTHTPTAAPTPSPYPTYIEPNIDLDDYCYKVGGGGVEGRGGRGEGEVRERCVRDGTGRR